MPPHPRDTPARLRELELWRVSVEAELRVSSEARATYVPMLLKLNERIGVIEARVAIYAAVGGALAGIVSSVVASDFGVIVQVVAGLFDTPIALAIAVAVVMIALRARVAFIHHCFAVGTNYFSTHVSLAGLTVCTLS